MEENEYKVNGKWMTEAEAKRTAKEHPLCTIGIKMNDRIEWLEPQVIWDLYENH